MSFIELDKSVKTTEWSMLDLHSHSHYEIYLLTSGSRTFFLSNALYKLSAPVLIIIPPHTLHKTEGGPFERYNINVSDRYLDDYQRHVFSQKSLCVMKLNSAQLKKLSDTFDQLNNIDKKQKYSASIINTLFSYAILQIDQLSTNIDTPSVEKEKSLPPLILKIIDYLNANYKDKITLADLSAMFFISKGTLIYNFNSFLSCSPIDYLLNIRLVKAKELLIKTKKSIREISELTGFSSANYFGLIFKQKEHLSPLAYRKLQKTKG